MTSRRHIELQALAGELARPLGKYHYCLGLAWRTDTGSPENDDAMASGNAALDRVEQLIRQWVAEHPEPTTAPANHDGEPCGETDPHAAHLWDSVTINTCPGVVAQHDGSAEWGFRDCSQCGGSACSPPERACPATVDHLSHVWATSDTRDYYQCRGVGV